VGLLILSLCFQGYLDQIINSVTEFKVLGLESNQSNYDCAKKRQLKYHGETMENVKYVQHTVNEDTPEQLEEFIKENFPDERRFCIMGLHSCADLTVQAMFTFLKVGKNITSVGQVRVCNVYYVSIAPR
jgi:DNA-binding MurR/RpiR family transcriptional regulator